MATLSLVGATPTGPKDLINENYVTNSLLAANLTQATVDAQIASDFAGYATKSYVDSRDALNANTAFVDAGDATRLHLSQIGVNSGVAGLGTSGLVDVARVPVNSTQRYPKPLWSPAAYNAGTVTATTETGLYTCPVADPGFVYKLLVFGEATGKVSLDNTEYPIVYVRVDSTAGQIIAYGAGVAESYQGAAPGTLSSRATAGSFTAPPSWTLVGGWVAQNGGGYSTTLSGNYMAVPTSETATISASLTFSGAVVGHKSTVSTGIRIVDNASTVLATSTQIDGTSGTCTVSWTGAVTTGALYGIQMGQSGADTGATVTSGFFAISGATVANSGPITVLPSALAAQTPKAGACTLFVDLLRSGGAATVSVLPDRPGLVVIPIPA